MQELGQSGAAHVRRVATFCEAVARRFLADQCLMRASALAYTSLLSIVPLLALMFAVLKGLGAQHRLEPVLLSRLSLDQETTDLIIGYIDRTNVSTLGTLGAAMLVFTVVSVLGTIEASFNHIWRVAQHRSPWRKVSDYLGVVLLTPFLLLAAVAITSAGQVHQLVQWVLENGYLGGAALEALRLSPLFINAAGIGVLYAVMPNRRPAWGPLVVSALLAGCAWHLVQVEYVNLQVGVARNNAIYGALAQLPVTLVWLYLSWTIVLGGAEVAAVLEFGAAAPTAAHAPDPQAVALHLLLRAADEFERGGHGVEPSAAARQLGADLATVQPVAAALQTLGWLVVVGPEPGRLVLARSPAGIELGGLAGLAGGGWLPPHCDPRARSALASIRAKQPELWSGRTLADVLREDGTPVERRAKAHVDGRGRRLE
jgi:membrane protein